jgi:hypothetical protein
MAYSKTPVGQGLSISALSFEPGELAIIHGSPTFEQTETLVRALRELEKKPSGVVCLHDKELTKEGAPSEAAIELIAEVLDNKVDPVTRLDRLRELLTQYSREHILAATLVAGPERKPETSVGFVHEL